jgi:hypothetical protein
LLNLCSWLHSRCGHCTQPVIEHKAEQSRVQVLQRNSFSSWRRSQHSERGTAASSASRIALSSSFLASQPAACAMCCVHLSLSAFRLTISTHTIYLLRHLHISQSVYLSLSVTQPLSASHPLYYVLQHKCRQHQIVYLVYSIKATSQRVPVARGEGHSTFFRGRSGWWSHGPSKLLPTQSSVSNCM